MIRALYDKNREFDAVLERMVGVIGSSLDDKDDDALIFCTGTTGTGKSSLMLHAYEAFDPDGCNIDQIGLNEKDHAVALKSAKDKDSLRFCGYDEANVSKRDHAKTYNKDLIKLYFQIRGLQIFHWWNNPSVDMIDKPFIQERMKGLIFIFTKDTKRPRLYYYFTKSQLLELWAKHSKLTHRILKSNANKYSLYRGWFRAYKGKLWQPYLEKKEDKMEFAVDDFFEKYGKETLTKADAARKLDYNTDYFYTKFKKLVEGKDLLEGIHYIKTATKERITKEGIQRLKELAA